MPAPNATISRWHQTLARAGSSLVARMFVGLLVGMVVVATALWWMVDRVLEVESAADRATRQAQAAVVVTRAIERETESLRDLANLLATDTELANAVYYHVMLEGELGHVQNALGRLPQGRRVEAQALLDARGLELARSGRAGLPARLAPAQAAAEAALVWSDRTVWVVAIAPIRRGQTVLGWLVLGATLQPMVDVLFPPHAGLQVRVADAGALGGDAAPAAIQLPTADADRPLLLALQTSDLLLPVRDKVLRQLRWALPLFALGLGALLGLALLRQLRPLRQIGQAARRVGQGDLYPPLPSASVAELAVVTTAFEQMLRDLRAFEVQRSQTEQHQRLQAIGRMAARVAHDINNPLTVIQTHLALLLRSAEATNPALRESLDKMQHHCQRCHRTVELLLQYGRPVRLQLAAVPLGSLCAEAARRHEQQRPGQVIRVHDSTGDALVLADALHIEQVIDNLLANACESAPGNPVELQLRREGQAVALRVCDNGPGFSAEARAHAFEPFFTSKRKGTGLGLASCQTIVHEHGGRIAILDEGPGATVCLWLPMALPAGASAAASADAGPPGLRPDPVPRGTIGRSAPG
jgi:signal transduction histidine kinase